MKNIEEFDVELMNHDELVLTVGGQCDCESGGASAAKAVKAFFNGLINALSKTPASSPYYFPGPKH
ncbi:hypothetical protein [Runella slithyformis]|uniref:Uncharacterized protein n=1 Tax=Runella slithyformis (strain ATCC 29530 / DSM 19594 / LMG 11500 / NCIMB 11436 / LSU 4) TaxID=761193 RepID=A0A7U3ZNB9_RUNSL|nr:hypothetical protein [Runella slithyformis]AEI50390.1 hypothetical protein Runsl_4038 [Runella slithyformis DSM 19594]